MMNCFVDTNLLVYAATSDDREKRRIAKDLLKATIRAGILVLSPQSLSETFRALTKQRRTGAPLMTPRAAGLYVQGLRPSCRAALDGDTILTAISLQAAHQTQWFDSVLLASALGASCKVFWSEDMQHGQIIGGMRILNPFVTPPHTVLQT